LILAPDKLEADIDRDLAPIYLISGDEPLLTAEAADLVRSRARNMGYSERTVLTADRKFDWGELALAGSSMSLFAEKRLIELRMPTAKPGTAGAKALADYAASPPDDALLLVLTAKMDKRSLQLSWAKSLASAGRVVQVWAPDRSRLPGWIGARMRSAGLKPASGVAELIADRVEGNLLAADQEIRKLSLLLSAGTVEAEDVARAVADSARYDVFDLVDAVSQGDLARSHRILDGLEGEGVEPTLVLWALVRELRALSTASWASEHGQRDDQALRSAGIWPRRQPAARAAMRRHGREGLLRLIRQAASVDRVIKGSVAGQPWQALADLTTAAASGLRARPRGAA
jgi:DNA polymerase-3 subunit delta